MFAIVRKRRWHVGRCRLRLDIGLSPDLGKLRSLKTLLDDRPNLASANANILQGSVAERREFVDRGAPDPMLLWLAAIFLINESILSSSLIWKFLAAMPGRQQVPLSLANSRHWSRRSCARSGQKSALSMSPSH